MSTTKLTRRRFLKLAGFTLGAGALVGSGITALCGRRPAIILPETTFGESGMQRRILVAYASRTGFTWGVAEAIGRTVSESGMAIDVRPMQNITDISGYHAVIAGSAIQGSKWLPEARQFIEKYKNALSTKPFAAFLTCMTLAMPQADKYRAHVATWMDPICQMVQPVSIGTFAGGLDINKIPAWGDRVKFRLSVMLGVWKEGDHRDWQAIGQWAKGLIPQLVG